MKRRHLAARPPNAGVMTHDIWKTWGLSARLPEWHGFDGRQSRLTPAWATVVVQAHPIVDGLARDRK